MLSLPKMADIKWSFIFLQDCIDTTEEHLVDNWDLLQSMHLQHTLLEVKCVQSPQSSSPPLETLDTVYIDSPISIETLVHHHTSFWWQKPQNLDSQFYLETPCRISISFYYFSDTISSTSQQSWKTLLQKQKHQSFTSTARPHLQPTSMLYRSKESMLFLVFNGSRGNIITNYSSLTMYVLHSGSNVLLHGNHPIQLEDINFSQLTKLSNQGSIATYFHITTSPSPASTQPIEPVRDNSLLIPILQAYANLFAEPTPLPPSRSHDRHIQCSWI